MRLHAHQLEDTNTNETPERAVCSAPIIVAPRGNTEARNDARGAAFFKGDRHG